MDICNCSDKMISDSCSFSLSLHFDKNGIESVNTCFSGSDCKYKREIPDEVASLMIVLLTKIENKYIKRFTKLADDILKTQEIYNG